MIIVSTFDCKYILVNVPEWKNLENGPNGNGIFLDRL